MVRMNITLPEKVAQKLNKFKNKSRFIADAVEEKIKFQERHKLLDKMTLEYQQMAKENKQGMNDWDAIAAAGWE